MERLARGVARAGVRRVVLLSSIGAGHPGDVGAIDASRAAEGAAADLPVVVLRAAYFVENRTGSIAGAISSGTLATPLKRLDRRIPHVSTIDIGQKVADRPTTPERLEGPVEFAGLEDLPPDDAAAALSGILGRTIVARALTREEAARSALDLGASPMSAEKPAAMAEAIDAGRVDATRPLVRGSAPAPETPRAIVQRLQA